MSKTVILSTLRRREEMKGKNGENSSNISSFTAHNNFYSDFCSAIDIGWQHSRNTCALYWYYSIRYELRHVHPSGRPHAYNALYLTHTIRVRGTFKLGILNAWPIQLKLWDERFRGVLYAIWNSCSTLINLLQRIKPKVLLCSVTVWSLLFWSWNQTLPLFFLLMFKISN